MNFHNVDRRAHPAGAVFSEWQAPDGWRLRRMDRPQPDGTDTRGTLIFAGGRGDFIEKYLEPLGHWHAQGWSVVSYDWRGQGRSRGNIIGGNFTDFDPLVADGAALIESVIVERPGPHVAVAHSMGGHILARILAERHPRLAAAVLVAPMLGINTAPVPEWLGRMSAATMTACGLGHVRAWQESGPDTLVRIRQANLTSCPERYADEGWWYEQEPGYRLGPPSWAWLSAAFRSMDRLDEAALQAIAVPVLIIATPGDRLVSIDAIRRAAAGIAGAEVELFPEAAHEILREADPVRIRALARIDAFLDARAPA
jgi:lysophospholipase